MYNTLTLASALLALITPALATYKLQDDYSASSFFDKFEFFTAQDPTHGFVQYIDQGSAQAGGLVSTNAFGQITLGVDSTNVAPNGRASVRLTSNAVYNHGLIILDLAHMPEGCGTWPAFWSVGPNWPSQGEIDIIEGVNEQATNAMTLHTGPNCGITNNGAFTGSIQTPSCDVAAWGQPTNAGCSIDAPNTNTYGAGFNAAGGGVYATEWTSSAITVYFFTASQVPDDIKSGNPNPSSWPSSSRLAQFQGACDIDSVIQNQQLVFDTTFCGDWAGGVWGSGSCASRAGSCTDFVANNPWAFTESYWQINSLKVYQDDGNAAPVTSVSSTSAGPTGIATGLPSKLTSLAPIPVTSKVPTPTTTVAVTPLPAGIWGGGSSKATTTTTTNPFEALTSAAFVTPPIPSSATPTTTTQSISIATPTPSTPAPKPYFGSGPVPASWFGEGGGIPVNWGGKDKAKKMARRAGKVGSAEEVNLTAPDVVDGFPAFHHPHLEVPEASEPKIAIKPRRRHAKAHAAKFE